ncbi:regulator of G-protein signaling domain-containing protein [Noviherbaspirillum galbum]|uniref:RGS domain-containing protein n=1 Tax=Noviherbaspirillum galbum TaxID=2709383 RepID=A0A6B3ST22_9BURK|nr:hypothetical protein [Noviherbaspirillum galbum]NEX63801.1 hypothetical protein [Noviherbaspirillum galbum]
MTFKSRCKALLKRPAMPAPGERVDAGSREPFSRSAASHPSPLSPVTPISPISPRELFTPSSREESRQLLKFLSKDSESGMHESARFLRAAYKYEKTLTTNGASGVLRSWAARKEAKRIVKEFIEPRSPHEINIDGPTRQAIMDRVASASESGAALSGDEFDGARDTVERMLRQNLHQSPERVARVLQGRQLQVPASPVR